MSRKYNRKCGRCGNVHEQSQMHRVKPEYSNNGWLCDECYEDIDMVENDYYCFDEF